ncbi:MAG: efflux RND transporter periplasmic adaptor subunit [Treponema sp.]|nr:efflux RND transporter periplasmic adaptor subunit [Treponema sp.]
MKFFRLYPVLFLLLLIILSGCEKSGDKNPEASGEETAAPVAVYAVNTTTAVQGQISDYIALSGDIIAGTTVDAYAETAGKIAAVYVVIGQWVNRGQNIAAIDPSRPGMDYLLSMATAPISGTIVTLPAQVGMTVSPAVPLARIAGGNALEIRLYVAERFISKIAMNLPCEINLDAWPGEVFQGSIKEIAPTVDIASRTMEIRVNVRNPGNKLKTGMFAKVKIITERKNNVVKIPVSAMISRFGENYIYVVAQDPENPEYSIVRKQMVTPGILIDGVLEIQEGLEPDQEIVVRGQTLLDDGFRINIIERTEPLKALE